MCSRAVAGGQQTPFPRGFITNVRIPQALFYLLSREQESQLFVPHLRVGLEKSPANCGGQDLGIAAEWELMRTPSGVSWKCRILYAKLRSLSEVGVRLGCPQLYTHRDLVNIHSIYATH